MRSATCSRADSVSMMGFFDVLYIETIQFSFHTVARSVVCHLERFGEKYGGHDCLLAC